MARRYRGNMSGERYCGNTSSREVHDLDNERDNCQIDEIIDAGHDRPFYTLAVAHSAGFDRDCSWCTRTA
jgi:hypothetical protein